jgi:hypothetical protein
VPDDDDDVDAEPAKPFVMDVELLLLLLLLNPLTIGAAPFTPFAPFTELYPFDTPKTTKRNPYSNWTISAQATAPSPPPYPAYDQSQTLGGPNTPMSVLVRLISETAFTKLLKRMPMALVGGFDAWRREVGERRSGRTCTGS